MTSMNGPSCRECPEDAIGEDACAACERWNGPGHSGREHLDFIHATDPTGKISLCFGCALQILMTSRNCYGMAMKLKWSAAEMVGFTGKGLARTVPARTKPVQAKTWVIADEVTVRRRQRQVGATRQEVALR